jgi:hypothetical protein
VATLGTDIRRDVIAALLTDLRLPAEEAITQLQKAEILLPRGPGRYGWPHALLQEHLFGRLSERDDSARMFKSAAKALRLHPLSNTRRVVRQRVINLLYAGENDVAAETFFDFLQSSWHGAQEPAPTLADLELFQGRLTGRNLALEHRWRAGSCVTSGRTEEATSRRKRLAIAERLAIRKISDTRSDCSATSRASRATRTRACDSSATHIRSSRASGTCSGSRNAKP